MFVKEMLSSSEPMFGPVLKKGKDLGYLIMKQYIAIPFNMHRVVCTCMHKYR